MNKLRLECKTKIIQNKTKTKKQIFDKTDVYDVLFKNI